LPNLAENTKRLQDIQNDPSYVQATQNLQNIQDEYANALKSTESVAGGAPITASDQAGQAGIINRYYQTKIANAQAAVNNILTARGQTITALGTAQGALTPITPGYNQQVISQMTGQSMQAGGTAGSLQDAVSRAVEMINSGTGFNDAAATLSGYGQGGLNALMAALPAGFDITQSNAKASAGAASTIQTGTIGGELTKSAETVKQHMITLKTAYDQLTAKFGIPLLNAGVNSILKQFGSGPLQSYNIALTNVRDELSKILGGGTATEGTRATAAYLLPDNMTPNQIDASIKTATELMNSKIQEYTRVAGETTGNNNSIQTPYGTINPNL
jgi:hypothetical protein